MTTVELNVIHLWMYKGSNHHIKHSLRVNPCQHLSPSYGGGISPLVLIRVRIGKIQVDAKANGIEPGKQPIEVIYMGTVEIVRKPAISIVCCGHLLNH